MIATADGIDLSDITTARDEIPTDEIAIAIDIGIETEIENTGQLAIAQHLVNANVIATGVISATIETPTTLSVHEAVAAPTTEIDPVATALVTVRGMTADGPIPKHDSALTTGRCMTE